MTSAECAKAAWAACVCAIIAARSATSLIITTRASRPGVTPTVTIAGKRSPFLRQSTTSYSPRPTRETSSLAACNSATDSSGQYGSGREHPSSSLSENPVNSHIFALTRAMRPSGAKMHEPVLQRVDDHLGDLQVPVQVPVRMHARALRARASAPDHPSQAVEGDTREGDAREPWNSHLPVASTASRRLLNPLAARR